MYHVRTRLTLRVLNKFSRILETYHVTPYLKELLKGALLNKVPHDRFSKFVKIHHMPTRLKELLFRNFEIKLLRFHARILVRLAL